MPQKEHLRWESYFDISASLIYGCGAGCDWGWQPQRSQLCLRKIVRSDFPVNLALRSLSNLALLDPPSSVISHLLLVSCQRVIDNWNWELVIGNW
ncbi:MAG: hypothetical protein HC894_18285 [Microcoleus sp. SM1_3_4]|nr:hypothetical protein [Microcoleus sp. SM1_3_4]